MQPCWHPHGTLLAWVEWNHPQMPWEGSRLRLGTVRYDVGHLPKVRDVGTLAGSRTVAIFQPMFSPNGRFLAYISNQSGWDNLYLYDFEEHTHRALTTDRWIVVNPPGCRACALTGFGTTARACTICRMSTAFGACGFTTCNAAVRSNRRLIWASIRFSTSQPWHRRGPRWPVLLRLRRCRHACLRCQSRARSARGCADAVPRKLSRSRNSRHHRLSPGIRSEETWSMGCSMPRAVAAFRE